MKSGGSEGKKYHGLNEVLCWHLEELKARIIV